MKQPDSRQTSAARAHNCFGRQSRKRVCLQEQEEKAHDEAMLRFELEGLPLVLCFQIVLGGWLGLAIVHLRALAIKYLYRLTKEALQGVYEGGNGDSQRKGI